MRGKSLDYKILIKEPEPELSALLSKKSQSVRTKERLQFLLLLKAGECLSACPELNPVERLFEELRKYTANEVFDDLTQIEELIEKLVNEYMANPAAVAKLTLFSYLNT